MRKLSIITLLFAPLIAMAQSQTGTVKFKNPSTLHTPKGYSHAAIVDLGNCKMIILSGQVSLDKNGNLVGKDDVGKQAQQVFENIKNALSECGADMKQIVKINYYLTDVSNIQVVRNVRDKYINTETPPTSTLVEVSKLFREEILLEIEVTAIVFK
ncbi:MAG: RidA family protein [Chryseolinea sp.]